uniref:RNA-directed RNA polymerase n=1 Tax=Suillus luteus mymonavirus 1 TaxID=3067819 RepID=A0AA50AHL0_9MONO|nr:RNA-dependent RNA polymerase [Suillus luteus mymonavirus 1]
MDPFDSLDAIGEFSGDLSSEFTNVSVKQVPEKHLDSPILISLLVRLQHIHHETIAFQKNVKPTEYDPRRSTAMNSLLQKRTDLAYSSIRKAALQYSDALDYCLKEPVILEAKLYPQLFHLGLDQAYRLHSDLADARRIFEIELSAYCDQLRGVLSHRQIQQYKDKCRPPTYASHAVVKSANRAQLWSDIIETYRKQYGSSHVRKALHCGPVRFICGDGFLLLKTKTMSRWQLATFEQVQMIQDCCLARHNVQCALSFGFHNGTPLLKEYVDNVIAWQERVLLDYGNDGYELVKAPEAIFKARLNTLTAGDILNYSSYDRTLDKMKIKEYKLKQRTTHIDDFDFIVRQVHDLNDAAELFGLSKLSGHPVVYANRSMASVQKEASVKGTILPFAVRQTERMFKHMVLSGYINEHASWPPFLCPPALNTVLRRHYVNHVTTLPLGSYPISDLDAIVFRQFVEYDYSEDYLKFLDDKAICPGASEMSKFWFGGHRVESRRLLQKILEVEHFDTVEMIERLRRGKFYPDEYVVELTQKERELKTAARCFCKLPYQVRTFFTSTEYNLKENFMSKYIPQQTMTMSNTETKSRLYNLVKDAKSKSRVLLEVDFSRWNLRWREETVHPISSILEDIFGLPGVFSQAHPFFEKATIVLTDKHWIPDHADPAVPITQWKESELVYRGRHYGGFEGIQQALWTLCTIAMMYWVLYDQNVSFLMAGQGDNQIFALTFTVPPEEVPQALRRLLGVMEVRCSMLNHEVKPDECIDSSTVLTYSKDIYVNGVHVLYNLKFASRTFKREEIDLPSLSTEIASISACSMACADSVYITPRAIFWKTFQTLRLLSFRFYSPNYEIERIDLSHILSNSDVLTFTMLLPGSLGGLPIMQWSRFFLKGEVDDLTWDIAAVRALAEHVPALQADYNNVKEGKFTSRTPDLTQLILDPHSIPVDRPKDLKRLVKDAVAERLPYITNNRWIRDIFNESSEAAGESLLRTLATSKPFYPQIMNDIYSLSPSGVRDALLSRFTMTRTINSITGNPNFAINIASANAQLLRFIRTRHAKAVRRVSNGLPIPRSYDAAQELRKLWNADIQQSCIGVYNPFDFRIQFNDQVSPMIFSTTRDAENSTTTLGPFPPNFGTKTRQKVSDHGFKIVTSSSTVADLKAITLTASELGGHPSLVSVLGMITHARSPWTLTQLLSVLPTAYGGTAAHRHAAINASAFSILGSRTVPTHINYCSDRAGLLSGGENDYPIAFQEFYLVLSNLYQTMCATNVLPTDWSIGFLLSDDYDPIPDEPVQCTRPTSEIKWKVPTTNKLVYATSLMTNELPTIPPLSVCPIVTLEKIPPPILVYNVCLAKYSSKVRKLSGTSLINHPVELMDMKEFSHIRLRDLITGLTWFIQAMALYAAVTEFTSSSHTVLKEYVHRLSHRCAPLLARLMVHPEFAVTQFAIEHQIVMRPGATGARFAADALSGVLFELTMISLRSREFLRTEVPLLLFADYNSYGRVTASIHAHLLVALSSRDINQVAISSHHRRTLLIPRTQMIINATTLSTVLNYASIVDHLAETIHNKNALHGTKFRLNYCAVTPAEAIRVLRDLPKDIRMLATPKIFPKLMFQPRNGLCTLVNTGLEGSIVPTHECRHTSIEDRLVDSFLSHTTRTIGTHSTALSVWYQLLSLQQTLIKKKRVLSVGVGHGAVAASALALGAFNIEGIDLQSSFPAVVQREGTYKPPEVLETGLSERFQWSPIVSEFNGNVLLAHQWRSRIYHIDTVIVDVELPNADTAKFIAEFADVPNFVIRVVCCAEWATYYYDMIGADFLYNTSALRTTHLQSFVLVRQGKKAHNQNANFTRWSITDMRPWVRQIAPSAKHVTRAFNRRLAIYGISVKELNLGSLTTVLRDLRLRYTNATDLTYASKLQYAHDQLITVQRLFKTYDIITRDDLKALDADWRSLLAQWLANTAFPRDTIGRML